MYRAGLLGRPGRDAVHIPRSHHHQQDQVPGRHQDHQGPRLRDQRVITNYPRDPGGETTRGSTLLEVGVGRPGLRCLLVRPGHSLTVTPVKDLPLSEELTRQQREIPLVTRATRETFPDYFPVRNMCARVCVLVWLPD